MKGFPLSVSEIKWTENTGRGKKFSFQILRSHNLSRIPSSSNNILVNGSEVDNARSSAGPVYNLQMNQRFLRVGTGRGLPRGVGKLDRGAGRKALFRKHGISEQTFCGWKRMDSRRLIETLDELMTERGMPMYTRSDNGAEPATKRLTAWIEKKGATRVFVEPGSPWENGVQN